MTVNIICVGKIKENYWKDAIAEYAKRLSKYIKLQIFEVEDEKTPDHASETEEIKIMKIEASRIEKMIKPNSCLIALAIEGKKRDSVSFSKHLEQLGIEGKSNITFLIGGSLGIDSDLKRKADELISFSDMTFPHQLMRVILLEQIYRSYRIMNHEPYHK